MLLHASVPKPSIGAVRVASKGRGATEGSIRGTLKKKHKK